MSLCAGALEYRAGGIEKRLCHSVLWVSYKGLKGWR